MEFAKLYEMYVHVLWGPNKVASIEPVASTTNLCLYVWGYHAFFVDDPATKKLIVKMETTRPRLRPEVVLATRPKPDGPPSTEWGRYTPGCPPGHYYGDDLEAIRLELHTAGIAPTVTLSGIGLMKALRIKARKTL